MLAKDMKTAWEARSRKSPFFYVETAHWDGNVERFFELGEVRSGILIDPILTSHPDIERGIAADIGCGLGRFTRSLGSRFDRAIGVDVSAGMVEKAKELNNEIDNIDFVEGDGVSFPINDKSIDFLWSYEVFQHMPTHEIVLSNLKEVKRVLHNTGRAFIHFRTEQESSSLSRGLSNYLPTWILRLLKQVSGKDPLTADMAWRGAAPLSQPEIKNLCTIAGLTIISLHDDPTHPPGSRVFALLRRNDVETAA